MLIRHPTTCNLHTCLANAPNGSTVALLVLGIDGLSVNLQGMYDFAMWFQNLQIKPIICHDAANGPVGPNFIDHQRGKLFAEFNLHFLAFHIRAHLPISLTGVHFSRMPCYDELLGKWLTKYQLRRNIGSKQAEFSTENERLRNRGLRPL